MAVYRDVRRKRDQWVYDFRHKGTRHWDAFPSERKAVAGEKAKRRALETAAPPPAPGPTPGPMTPTTFLEVSTTALKLWGEADHDTEWVRTKRYILKSYFQAWMTLSVDEITPAVVRARMLEIKGQVSNEAANRYLKILRAAFNAAGIDPNPTRSVEFFPRLDQPQGEYIPTKADIDTVMLKAAPLDASYLKTGFHTLGRPFEVMRLRWADVDFAMESVTLWTRKRSKDRSWTPRKIPMNKELRSALLVAKRVAREGQEYVFPNKRTGRTYTRRPKLLKTLCREAGVTRFQWRGLRKSAATHLLEQGIDIATISQLLGHTSVETTMRYLGIDENKKRDAVQKLTVSASEMPVERKVGNQEVGDTLSANRPNPPAPKKIHNLADWSGSGDLNPGPHAPEARGFPKKTR